MKNLDPNTGTKTRTKLRLVLLPGMDGTGKLFARFSACAVGTFDLQIVSYPPRASSYAELNKYVRQSLPMNGPYIVLGESFSGPLVAMLRSDPPPGLVGVILCASFVSNPRPSLGWVAGLLRVLPIPPGWQSLARSRLLEGFSTHELRAELEEVLSEVPSDVLRDRLRQVLAVDETQRFATGTLPVLYLLARHDRVVPRSASRHVQTLAPAALIVDIEAPHFLLQVAPADAVAAIAAFARRIPEMAG